MAVPSSRSNVHLTSLAVNGLPSCHLTPWRNLNERRVCRLVPRPLGGEIGHDRVQAALRHLLVVHHEIVEYAHRRPLAGDRRLLVDRHAGGAVEEVDLENPALLLRECEPPPLIPRNSAATAAIIFDLSVMGVSSRFRVVYVGINRYQPLRASGVSDRAPRGYSGRGEGPEKAAPTLPLFILEGIQSVSFMIGRLCNRARQCQTGLLSGTDPRATAGASRYAAARREAASHDG